MEKNIDTKTEEILRFVRKCFRQSVEESTDIQDVALLFPELLSHSEIFEIQRYSSAMKSCGKARMNTFCLTNLLEDIIFVSEYLSLYRAYNSPELEPHVDFSGRRKSYVSEAKKTLNRILKNKKPEIKDRFACRLVFFNSEEEQTIRMAEIIANDLIEFFCDYNHQKKEKFLSWVCNHKKLDSKTKSRLEYIASLTFELAKADTLSGTEKFKKQEHPDIFIPEKTEILTPYMFGVKNYIMTPKNSGYQSLHIILQLPDTSPICPGSFFEIQLRTFPMHIYAEVGPASTYEEDRYFDLQLDDVFKVDPSKMHLEGIYLDSSGKCIDMVGFLKPKMFKSRTVTKNSVRALDLLN